MGSIRMISLPPYDGSCRSLADIMQATSNIHIDQILHGYDRGHKELVASISLDDQSRALMLILSDSLATSGLDEGVSYLTSYPLRHASKHVLARTWAAGRGYRPGSVWTHSLIIDYQALTLIHDLNILRDLFKYPEKERVYDYKNPILISNFTSNYISNEQDSRTVDALVQLYGKNAKQEIKIPHLNNSSDEILALKLWRQMWPGLRRNFAFITCISNDFSSVDAECILHFVDYKNYQIESVAEPHDEGYRVLSKDLNKSGPTDLRLFLGRYVIESKYPRKLVIPLAELQSHKKIGLLSSSLEQAISLSEDEKLPRLALDTLAECLSNKSVSNLMIIKILRLIHHKTIGFELKNLTDRIDFFSDAEIKILFNDINYHNQPSIGYEIFSHILKSFTTERLLNIITDENRILILKNRPELVKIRDFWPKSDFDISKIVWQIYDLEIFNLDNAIDVFGYDIEKETISILLNETTNLSKSFVSLICDCKNEISEITADWILKKSSRFVEFVDIYTKTIPNIIVANKLARSQIKSGLRTENPIIWSYLIMTSLKDNNQKIDSSCLVVGYLSALLIEEENSLALAKAVYDQLQYSVRDYRLSTIEDLYLKEQIHPSSQNLPLSTSISRSAIIKWSPLKMHNQNLGALEISRNPTYLKELIHEFESVYGYRKLEEILSSDELNIETKSRIKWILRLKKSKKSKTLKKNNIFRWWI